MLVSDLGRDPFQMVYDELKKLAAHQLATERPGHSLNPTALVHEAYLRLTSSPPTEKPNRADRKQFFLLAAEAMRHILIDHARYHRRKKRGAGSKRLDIPLQQLPEPQKPVALAIHEALEALAMESPEAAELVKLLNSLGTVHAKVGRKTESIADFHEGEKIMSRLFASTECNYNCLHELALIRHNLASELFANDQWEESRKLFILAQENCQSLAIHDPGNWGFRFHHAKLLEDFAACLETRGEFPLAIQQIGLSVKMLEQLEAETREVIRHSFLAKSLTKYSELLNKSNKPAEALPLACRAKSISEELMREYPSRPEMKTALAASCHQIGWAHELKNELPEAATAYEQALGILEKLSAEFPAVPQYPRMLGESCNILGMVWFKLKQNDKALTVFTKAKIHLKKALSLSESSPQVKAPLSKVLLNLSCQLVDNLKYQEALTEIDQAAALDQSRNYCRLWRAAVLVKLGQHQEAIQAVTQTGKEKTIKPEELVFAALICSLAVDELKNTGSEAARYSETGKELLSRVVGKVTARQLDEFTRYRRGVYWVSTRTQTYEACLVELESTPHSR